MIKEMCIRIQTNYLNFDKAYMMSGGLDFGYHELIKAFYNMNIKIGSLKIN